LVSLFFFGFCWKSCVFWYHVEFWWILGVIGWHVS
jgi:hypothetical protein